MPETENPTKPAPKGYAKRLVAKDAFKREKLLQYNQDGTEKRKHDAPIDIDAELDEDE